MTNYNFELKFVINMLKSAYIEKIVNFKYKNILFEKSKKKNCVFIIVI